MRGRKSWLVLFPFLALFLAGLVVALAACDPTPEPKPKPEEPAEPAAVSVETEAAEVEDVSGGSGGSLANTAEVEDLAEEIYIGLGGGGGPCGFCPMEGSPQIVWGSMAWSLGSCLCVSGCPASGTVDVRMHLSGGATYSARYEIQQQGGGYTLTRPSPPLADLSQEPGWVEVERGAAAVQMLLWWPVQLARGQWGAEVTCGGVTVEAELKRNLYGFEAISVVREGGANPFEGERGGFCMNNVIAPGSRIEIAGANYPPGRKMPLGVYHDPDLDGLSQRVFASYVTSDGLGRFATTLQVDAADPPGAYFVVAVADPDAVFGSYSGYVGDKQYTDLISLEGQFGCYAVRE
jgi:hypothetical protein